MTTPTDRTAALLAQLAQLQEQVAQAQEIRDAVPDGTFEDQLVTAREQASGFGSLFSESSPGALPGLRRKHKLHRPDGD